jgi:hypothetical protein
VRAFCAFTYPDTAATLPVRIQEIEKAGQTEKTLEKAELIYMRPTDFSPMK